MLEIVRDSFVSGLVTSFRVIGVIALVGVAIAVFLVGGRLGTGREEAAGDERQSRPQPK